MKRIPWHIVILGIFLFFFFWGLNAQYPVLGHDYFYFFPRMLEGKWHFLRQGLLPLRFAPHLCGGFPQYGNPQDLFYSLPQFLSFFLDLWTAAQLSIFIGMVLGYVGWVFFGKDVLRLTSPWSHVLALVCTANGFFFVHRAVGHLSYFTLPLMSWVLWVLFHREKESNRFVLLQRATFATVLAGIFLYSGSHLASFIILPLIVFFLPFDLLLSAEPRNRLIVLGRRCFFFGLASLTLGASKLVAVYSVMRVLPRSMAFYEYTAGQNVLLFAAKALWAFPQLPWFFTQDPINRIHEESMFTSPVVLIGIMVLAWLFLKNPHIGRWKKVFLAITALCIAGFILGIVHGVGIIPETLQKFPFFSSLRVPERFLLILALLFSIGGIRGLALLFQKERWKVWNARAALGASVLTVAAFIGAYSPLLQSLEYTLPYDQINASLHADPDPLKQPITKVQNLRGLKVSDFHYFFQGSTGSRCYETIQSSNFPALQDGPVNLAWDDALNVYNPACIAYGKENGCRPGDRIDIDDLPNLERFINGKQTTWKLSAAQHVADGVTLVALLGIILVTVLSALYTCRKIWSARG